MARWGFLGRITGGIFSNAIGFGTGTAIGSALEPLAQLERNEIWPRFPFVPLPPADAATAAVQGALNKDQAAAAALKSGVDRDVFDVLFHINGDPIAPEQALDLWNRGVILESDVDRALLQSRIKPEWVDTFKRLKRQILQVAELAEMSVQGILSEDEAAAHAAQLGYDRDDFHKMHLLAGNPPGPQDTLSLWNRGIFNEQEATLALMQSRLKPEWIEKFKQSRIRPASTAQAVEAVVKERITHDAGARIAAENGIARDTFDLMVNAAGRPIGIVQALTLFNRKVFQRSDVEEVVARSNVRTEYTDAIIHLAVRYPPLFQIGRLVTNGSIDDEYAIQLITEQGYPHKLAEGIVKAAHSTKTQKHKDLTVSEIEALYQGEGISRSDAVEMLSQLDYDRREAAFILDLAEFRRIARYLEAVINRVHAGYVNHRIGITEVTTILDNINIPADQRENLLDLWNEERSAAVKVLTPAQITKAVKQTIMTHVDGKAELMNQGYSDRDSEILLRLAGV